MDKLLLELLFTLASLLSTIVVLSFIVTLYVICFGARGIHLNDGLPGAFDDSEQYLEEEASALELMDDRSRQSYLMAKRWIEHNAPNSADTDISLSQFMTIQEKAVAAWEFTFDIMQQSSVTVHDRTDIEFRGSDDICCVQTNLPLPKQKEVYYWEVKIYEMAEDTKLAVGLTTKPYPVFRLPGMHRYSVAYESTAVRRLNQPFSATPYGRPWQRGDVIGVGYRTRTGTIFFTHNGKKLDDVVHGMRVNLFPTVGATGLANLYVNFGQAGFVFIQANVKEWGFAPAQGSLAPPPAYGNQEDSLLLESTSIAGPGPYTSNSHWSGIDAPPYVQRRSSDEAHRSVREGNSEDELRTPPGSPPEAVRPRSVDGETDNVDNDGASTTHDSEEDANNTPTVSTPAEPVGARASPADSSHATLLESTEPQPHEASPPRSNGDT